MTFTCEIITCIHFTHGVCVCVRAYVYLFSHAILSLFLPEITWDHMCNIAAYHAEMHLHVFLSVAYFKVYFKKTCMSITSHANVIVRM